MVRRSLEIGTWRLPQPGSPAMVASREKRFLPAARGFYFYIARSIAVENTNDAGEVVCNKPEAQAKGI